MNTGQGVVKGRVAVEGPGLALLSIRKVGMALVLSMRKVGAVMVRRGPKP